MSPLGQILDATVPEKAVTAALQTWVPTYLAHIARAKALDPAAIALPKSWQTVNERIVDWPEDHLPAIYVVATGIVERPVKDGEGTYRAAWAVGVAAVVEANTAANTDALAKLYAAAIRGSLLQHPSLGGVARGTEWLAESYDTVPAEKQRSLRGCELVFSVELDQVLNVYEGIDAPLPGDPTPTDPPPEPPDWPDADTVDVVIERQEE